MRIEPGSRTARRDLLHLAHDGLERLVSMERHEPGIVFEPLPVRVAKLEVAAHAELAVEAPSHLGVHVSNATDRLGRLAEVAKILDTTTPEIAAAQKKWEAGLTVDSRPQLGEWHFAGTFKGGNPKGTWCAGIGGVGICEGGTRRTRSSSALMV